LFFFLLKRDGKRKRIFKESNQKLDKKNDLFFKNCIWVLATTTTTTNHPTPPDDGGDDDDDDDDDVSLPSLQSSRGVAEIGTCMLSVFIVPP